VLAVGIDTGGTFTDFCVGDRVFKLRSTPEDPSKSVLDGLATLAAGPLRVVYGTTVATNALLERQVARTAFVTTLGVEDLLEIGRQDRPALYATHPEKPATLVAREDRFGVRERLLSDGTVETPLEIGDLVERIVRSGVEAVAVCLLHSYRNPAHERALGRALERTGLPIALSHEIANEFREYERASTTAANAALMPVLGPYVKRMQERLAGHRFEILQSNGGTALPAEVIAEPVRTVLSGPAGGVVAAAELARLHGISDAVSFDMGGTSSDVSLIRGEPSVVSECLIGGVALRVPVLDVHTVGAGGGSIAWMDALGALRVGPKSAGADPGPACYGAGGTRPTVTDAHLVAGHLAEDDLLAGTLRLDAARAHKAVGEQAHRAVGAQARDILRVADATMERALRTVTVRRGIDPRPCTLIAFGGAGGLHACSLADALGMRAVLVPKDPGTFSAHGMRTADRRRDFVQTLMLSASEFRARLKTLVTREHAWVDARYVGQSHELKVVADGDVEARFHAAHHGAYGYSDKQREIEIVNLREAVIERFERPEPYPPRLEKPAVAGPARMARADLDRAISGPTVLTEATSTVVVPEGWTATRLLDGALLLERA